MSIVKRLRKIDLALKTVQTDLEEGLKVPHEDKFQAKQVQKIRDDLTEITVDIDKIGDDVGGSSTQIHGTGTGKD